MNVENEYLELLKSWCDGLIRLQFQKEDNPRLDRRNLLPVLYDDSWTVS